MNICKDCQHVMPQRFGPPKCALAPYTDPVSGEARLYFCETERHHGACGIEGGRFEPREIEAAA